MTVADGAGTHGQPSGEPWSENPRVDVLVRRAVDALAAAGVPSPRVDAELLLAHVTGAGRADVARAGILRSPAGDLIAAGGPTPDLSDPSVAVARAYAAVVARRAGREPLQHITGRAPFRRLELAVGPGVFVPRPETEQVAQVAIDEAAAVMQARGGAVVVDLCAGSAAIALAVASEVPGARVFAVELDADAYEWAARNVAEARAGGVVVELVRGDARRALAGSVEDGGLDGACDVVVTNPPYIPPGAVPRDPEVSRHDPAVALYGLGADGLAVPRGITAAAARLLRPGGLYVMEHAESQAPGARAMVDAAGLFESAATRVDLTGRARMVTARRARRGGSA